MKGVAHGVVDTVWQPVAQVLDLSQVVIGLASGGKYEPHWFSHTGQNAGKTDYGEGIARAVAASNPVTGLAVGAADIVGRLAAGDYNGAAEGAGGILGGVATGKAASRYMPSRPGESTPNPEPGDVPPPSAPAPQAPAPGPQLPSGKTSVPSDPSYTGKYPTYPQTQGWKGAPARGANGPEPVGNGGAPQGSGTQPGNASGRPEGLPDHAIEVPKIDPNVVYVKPNGEALLPSHNLARNSDFRKGVRDETFDDASRNEPDGKAPDPDPAVPRIDRGDNWQMGHRPSMEYSKERDYATQQWLDGVPVTRKSFLDIMNDAGRYRPETPATNAGHEYEDPSRWFIPSLPKPNPPTPAPTPSTTKPSGPN